MLQKKRCTCPEKEENMSDKIESEKLTEVAGGDSLYKYDSFVCPDCGSVNPDVTLLEPGEGIIVWHCVCKACGKAWNIRKGDTGFDPGRHS